MLIVNQYHATHTSNHENKTHASKLVLLVAALVALAGGCSRSSISGIQCSLDEGWLISDDIYFINSSGRDLSEVRVTMTLTGETGAQKAIQRYWSTWHLGDKQHISIAPGDSVIKTQRVDLSGNCDQGSIGQSWVKR